MTEEIQLRPVKKEDFHAWQLLWLSYNALYGRHGETALSPEITQTTWSRFFDSYEPVHALVAENTGQILGFTHFLYHRSTIQIGPTCYLQDLFIAESARGQGVARKLIEEVYAHANAAGSARVYWQTNHNNTSAMKLYDKIAQKSEFVLYRKML